MLKLDFITVYNLGKKNANAMKINTTKKNVN